MVYRGVWVETGKAVEVQVEGSRIVSVQDIEREAGANADLPYLSMGFFDLQVNGYGGIDYVGEGLTPEKVLEVCHSLLRSGTTRHLATLITAPRERLLRNLKVIAEARKRYPFVHATLVGVHMEGPFISEEDGPRGAHDRAFTRDPDVSEFEEWWKASEGAIRLVTLAPERQGGIPFIQHLRSKGVVAAIGHTAASAEAIHQAIQAGATLSTHLGNGSHAQIPRLRNYIWEQLASDELSASIICDGFHLPPSVVKVISRVKGAERTILVSDVAFLAGLQPGFYRWGHLDVELHPDGRITQVSTPFFAGAGHLLDRDVAQYVKHAGVPLADGIRACTTAPARLMGLPEDHARLTPGTPAHLVLFRFSPGSEALRIEKVVAEGEEFTSSEY